MYSVYSFFEGSDKNSTQTQKHKLHTVLVCGLARVYQPQTQQKDSRIILQSRQWVHLSGHCGQVTNEMAKKKETKPEIGQISDRKISHVAPLQFA